MAKPKVYDQGGSSYSWMYSAINAMEIVQVVNQQSMKSDHQQRVEKFMHLAQQEVPDKPTEPSEHTRILRAKLIYEEAMETIEKGLGVQISSGPLGTEFWCCDPFNMVETIDGCADLIVVTTGTMSACGVPDKPFQEEVDNNNLAKFGPGGYRDTDGKWKKPPGHKPPDIAGLLRGLMGTDGEYRDAETDREQTQIKEANKLYQQHEQKAGREPVAWMFELATHKEGDVYTDWKAGLDHSKPCVPKGSIRNLVPLYAMPTQEASDGTDPLNTVQ